MPDPSRLDDRLARRAHDAIAGRDQELAGALRASQGPLTVAATPRTIYRLESLFRFARDEGASLTLGAPQGLSPKETAFYLDFKHRFLADEAPPEEKPAPLVDDALSFAASLLDIFSGRRAKPAPAPETFRSALLIGAYGGEHVGDAAILGGVLLDLNRSFGVVEATVLSTRPAHTERLVASLDTPVSVTVARYDYAMIRERLSRVDALVFAGGPLMDLPRMLVKHLSAARRAARLRKPFLIRRIGVGPFSKSLSRWTARQIALRASALSVRTSGAAKDPIVADLSPDIKTDPAFDYLASRATLSRLTAEERGDVDALLEGTQGRRLIGVNIRPIRHDWSPKGKDYAADSETKFYEEAAAALKAYADASPSPVTFVFFPMNPIQLGASDLAAAYRLHRLVGGAIDFRVLEADPDIDGVLYLLRRLDGAIAMRFHGAIFCLSQNLPTIGVDYYPGQGGKVEQLFRDRGLTDLARRIDEVDREWLIGAMRKAFGGG